MGSERINRNNKTKADSFWGTANQYAQAWMDAINPLSSTYTAPIKNLFGAADTKEAFQSPASERGDINKGFNVAGVQYYPDGTPFDSPGEGYSIDQYGRTIPHSWQKEGQTMKPGAADAPATDIDPVEIDPDKNTSAPDSAAPALGAAQTWQTMRNMAVADSASFGGSAPTDNTNDYSVADSAIFGRDLAESDAIKGGGYTETLITPDGIGETTINKADNKASDWSSAKAKAASASAFLNAPAGQGALGPLAAADAAVGVSRGGDKDGSFLNLSRDGKTYQIRGSQQDMATAAAKARAGANIFGDFDFKELPVNAE